MNIFNYLLGAVWLAMMLAALVDCVKSNIPRKTGWVAVILLVPFLGPVLYFLFAPGRYVSEL